MTAVILLPWSDKLDELGAAVSVAQATWWLVLVTIILSVATFSAVLAAFFVQKRQFDYEREKEKAQREQRARLAAGVVRDAHKRIQQDLEWLEQLPEHGGAPANNRLEVLHTDQELMSKFIDLENEDISLLNCLVAAHAAVSTTISVITEAGQGNRRHAIAELERLTRRFESIVNGLPRG